MNVRTGIALLASAGLLFFAAGCGDDDGDDGSDDATVTETTDDAADDASDDATDDDGDDGLEFELETEDDTVDFDGTAQSCDNPDESTLSVEFTDGTGTATVEVSGGTGSVVVTGGPEFEGRIEQFQIGDDGSVTASGHGTIADDSAQPTTFTLTGSCMP
ncbi:hypothetical protein CLV56_3964 [Mumia flava]|uniref:Lipoprotein antigen n=1 Tax=Mumia flava TaxID=1348852 RepID=A0A0B2B9R7_9ACTN|nr:hypothetical protein [Mumia flava]PJJ48260.1 hypothetical protein CLV56_3964 [Mumia flava]